MLSMAKYIAVFYAKYLNKSTASSFMRNNQGTPPGELIMLKNNLRF